MMNFISNENFPFPSVKLLRDSGHSIISITEEMPGISDLEALKVAKENQRIILTFDKDYGEIIFNKGIKNPPSVIFFRYKGNDPLFAGNFLKKLFDRQIDLSDAFTVIEEKGIRQKKYKT